MGSFFHRHPGLTPYLLLAPGLLWLVVFFVVPLAFLAYQSLQSGIFPNFEFTWEFSNFTDGFSDYRTQFGRSFLYAGIATTAALANLNYIATNRLRENARDVGSCLHERVRELQTKHAVIGDVRGMGLMQAVEFVVDRVTKEPATELTARLHDEAKRRGLLVGKAGLNANVFRLSPPLIISRADVDEAIRILDESLTAVA